VQAVVHAHPPHAVALAHRGGGFPSGALSESYLVLGRVPVIPYTTPTTKDVPDALRPHLPGARALLMDRHGSITVGATLDQAYLRLEALEHAARILILAGPGITELGPEELARLDGIATPADR
jgi:L-fuculose-phosphate aldolase